MSDLRSPNTVTNSAQQPYESRGQDIQQGRVTNPFRMGAGMRTGNGQ